MALNLLGLGFVFEAVDHASHVIHNIEEKISNLAEKAGLDIEGLKGSFAQLTTGLGAAFVGMEGLQKGFEFAEHAAEGESALISLRATTSATADEIERMEEAATEFTRHSKFDDTTAIRTLESLRKQALDTEQAIQLLGPALSFAEIAKISPEQAGAGLAKVLKAYEVDLKDAAIAVDQMTLATRQWGLSAEMLPTGLARAEGGARRINASMTEVMMVTALVKDGFKNQMVAMSQVSNAMATLSTDKAQAQFKKLKEAVDIKDAAGRFRKFSDIAADLSGVLAKMGPDKERDWLEKTFGKDGAAIMTKTIEKIRHGVKDMNGELVTGAAAVKAVRGGYIEAEGSAKKMIDILHEGFEAAVHHVHKTGNSIKEELGKGFLTVMTPLLHLAAGAMEAFLEVLRATPMPLKVMGALLFIAGSGLLLVSGGIMALGVLLPIATTAWEAGTAALMAFNKAAIGAMLPVLPWIIGLGLIAVGLYYFFFEGQRVTKWLSEFCDWLGRAAPYLLLLANSILFMMIPLGLFTGALTGLGAALTWVRGQMMLMYISMLLNPFGVALGAVVLLTLFLIKLNGGWKGFVQAWKVGIEDLGAWLDKWLVQPLKWVGEALGLIGPEKKKGGPDDLETDINKLVRVDRSGKVIGRGIQMDDAVEPEGGPHLPGMPEGMMPKMPAGYESLMSGDAGQRIGAGSPADVQAMLDAASSKDPGPMSFDYVRLAEEMAKRPMTGNVMLDGQKVGEILSNSSRTAAARAGVPVNYSE